ncbi:MAG: Ig-like domain-containing protein, partial [Candidatus Pacebacteria bacterium]|nr:Ig-like domain-containing protein [Candidatus Paceibacterota bacterium]
MTKKIFTKMHDYFLQNKKKSIAIALFLLVLSVSGVLLLTVVKDRKPGFINPRSEYAQVYSIVNDKISESASIVINLPANMKISKLEAQDSTTFSPEIKGIWIETEEKEKIIFKPEEKLKLNRYYSVILETADSSIGGDFLIVDDPKVLTVFPKAGSEASEESEITVMFNRPMTPITTLDVLGDFDIPIEISPATAGRFKWIGTRTVQFVADERLTRSSNYTVKIKSDFVSMDGLKVDDFLHNFQTRVLRYQFADNGHIIYNSPIRIAFNQPVDLRKTISEITLKNVTANNQQIDFIAEYGAKSVYDKKSKKYEKTVD